MNVYTLYCYWTRGADSAAKDTDYVSMFTCIKQFIITDYMSHHVMSYTLFKTNVHRCMCSSLVVVTI